MKIAIKSVVGTVTVLSGLAVSAVSVQSARAEANTPTAAATAAVEVRLSERVLVVRVGEEVLGRYPVAIGKASHETPKGTFQIRRMVWNPSWRPPDAEWAKDKKPTPPGDPKNPMGKVKIFFKDPDYYIHGTNDPSTIGKAASHGCIRMRNQDVIALAKIVMEHGGATRPQSWFRRVINRATDTQEVRLSKPITVRVRA